MLQFITTIIDIITITQVDNERLTSIIYSLHTLQKIMSTAFDDWLDSTLKWGTCVSIDFTSCLWDSVYTDIETTAEQTNQSFQL